MSNNSKFHLRGFTLIEVMVAVGIIVILTGIAIVGADSARKTARDNQRVTDIQLIQLKLEAYRAEKGVYPASIYQMNSEGYFPSLPAYQVNNYFIYKYAGTAISSCGACVSYHLGVKLETNNSALQKAKHKSTGISCPVNQINACDGIDFNASDAANNPAPNLWYDVVSPNDFNP